MASTPKYGHEPIAMRAAADDFDDINARGDFYINAEGSRFVVAIPSPTGGGWTYIDIPISRDHSPGKAWGWDGNRNSPTLTPSIHTGGHWHGFVRAGKLVEA